MLARYTRGGRPTPAAGRAGESHAGAPCNPAADPFPAAERRRGHPTTRTETS
jgi:hypothetical protein